MGSRNYDLSTPIAEARGRFFFRGERAARSRSKVGLYLIANQPGNAMKAACLGKKPAVIHLVKIATGCIPHPDEFIIPP